MNRALIGVLAGSNGVPRVSGDEPIFLVGPIVGLIVKIVAEVIKKAVYEKILSKDGVPLINNRFSCLLLST